MVRAAGPAADVATLIRLAQADGWTVNVISTPSALSFLDIGAVEALIGSPVRSEYRTSASGPRTLAVLEAVIVAPATYNTINKLALGVNDNYALGSLAEAIGRGTRVVVVPFVNAALAARLPYQHAVPPVEGRGCHGGGGVGARLGTTPARYQRPAGDPVPVGPSACRGWKINRTVATHVDAPAAHIPGRPGLVRHRRSWR